VCDDLNMLAESGVNEPIREMNGFSVRPFSSHRDGSYHCVFALDKGIHVCMLSLSVITETRHDFLRVDPASAAGSMASLLLQMLEYESTLVFCFGEMLGAARCFSKNKP
jgi:hypothetical protein